MKRAIASLLLATPLLSACKMSPIQVHDDFVIDAEKGLEWQRDPGRTFTFDDARAYCARLELDGKTGWRLPTAGREKEPSEVDDLVTALNDSEYRGEGGATFGFGTSAWATSTHGGWAAWWTWSFGDTEYSTVLEGLCGASCVAPSDRLSVRCVHGGWTAPAGAYH